MLKSRWREFSLAQQLGNIGSEVNRAVCWKEKGDKKAAEKAAERVLELIDLTISDDRWRDKLKEVLRLREVFCDYFFDLDRFDISSKMFTDYFIPFAMMSQR